jgi:hypothetical protein
MDDINRHTTRSLDGPNDPGGAPQISETTPYSYLEAQPGTLPYNTVNAELLQLPFAFRNSVQAAAPSATSDFSNLSSSSTRSAISLSLGVENPRDFLHRLPPYTSSFQTVSSATDRMPSLDQLLALLEEERQRTSRAVPPPATSSLSDRVLSIEQQLSSYMEERQRRSASTSATSYRTCNIEQRRQLASMLEQQQQQQQQGTISQQFQATNNAPDRTPTFEQLRGSLNDDLPRRHGSLQATRSSVQNSASTIDEHLLASLIEEQQGRSGAFQGRERMSIIEQQLASLIENASTSSAFFFPSNHMPEHQTSQQISEEDLQLLAQLQRNAAPQAQLESQAQARAHPFGHAEQGHFAVSLPSAVPVEAPISVPPAYGRNGQLEAFPEKLYRLLAEAERDGNDQIISFTPDGRAFKIHNRQAFIEEVSPKYFRHARITSFVRQLNFYGFKKLLDGPNRGGFANPPFLRGHPELLAMIKRKEVAPRPKQG